jgi:hypothetical protein
MNVSVCCAFSSLEAATETTGKMEIIPARRKIL